MPEHAMNILYYEMKSKEEQKTKTVETRKWWTSLSEDARDDGDYMEWRKMRDNYTEFQNGRKKSMEILLTDWF